jgi:MOSC domain-containing protein YiiM
MGVEARVNSIYITPEKGAKMKEVLTAFAIKGRGLEGDRYFEGEGFWQNTANPRQTIREVTLISADDIRQANLEFDTDFKPEDTRRQVVVEGDIDLVGLIGKRFRVGEVVMYGVEECTPCNRPSERSGKPGFEKALRKRGGIRAQILFSGFIYPGDCVVALI